MRDINRFTVHTVFEDGNAIFSKNNVLFNYNINTDIVEMIIELPYRNLFQNRIRNEYVTRITRGEIAHVIGKDPNNLLVFFNWKIYRIINAKIDVEYHNPTCRRPLNVHVSHDYQQIIWGDYIRRKDNPKVNIYSSQDFGKTWKIIYSFPSGRIRHIHNIIFDKIRSVFWILTGDSNHESGIWKTVDFNNIVPILSGAQKYRTVSIIPTKDGLIIPSDTAAERNKIRYYYFSTNKLVDLIEIEGSAMYSDKIGSFYFISTSFESNAINKKPTAELWCSSDGIKWVRILCYKKDLLPVKLFRYPEISIPKYYYNYNKDIYYFSLRSVKGGVKTIILNDEEIRKLINE